MRWGTIELEDEVVEWLERLDDDSFGQAERYIDLLVDEGGISVNRSPDSCEASFENSASAWTAGGFGSRTTSRPGDGSCC